MAMPDDNGNPLKVEKLSVEVTMIMSGGDELTGTIFLDLHSRHHAGPERMDDVLNSAQRFIPLQLQDGRMVLLNRERIVTGICRAQGRDDYEELTKELLSDFKVTIRLSDGRTINGAIRTDLPKEHARLSDLLNLHADFVRVVDGEIENYVNRTFANWFLEG